MSPTAGRVPPAATLAVLLTISVVACGKKGPPLPPIVRLPQAPSGLTAMRRGEVVDLQFTVPSANTDGTKPANVDRVDLYGFTGRRDIADQLLIKHGTRVGSVPVKAPRDPNAAVDPDDEEESADDAELEGAGMDQGAVAHVEEALTPASMVATPATAPKKRSQPDAAAAFPIPLSGPPAAPPVRVYVTVGINKSGRKGPLSKRVFVPLVPPPPPPAAPTITYNEKEIDVRWPTVAGRPSSQSESEAGVLPSRTFLPTPAAFAYNVYDTPPDATSADAAAATRLTTSPTEEAHFTDSRIEWGAERCYTIRTVETIDGMPIESGASPSVCEKLVDTFPPAAPAGLMAVASEGSISLIWQPNQEKDLAGYIVLRGPSAAGPMTRVTPEAIQDATFRDTVAPGSRYAYAVQAIDKAGNASKPSAPVEETAR